MYSDYSKTILKKNLNKLGSYQRQQYIKYDLKKNWRSYESVSKRG